tara:strand:+ start:11786 stop:12163 length:378 start_codon:yes stop_codon:yes gene_type:complete
LKTSTAILAITSRARCFAALLIAVFLFAQWAGWQHRVIHADWDTLSSTLVSTETTDWHADTHQYQGEKSHSCLLFDAATLACSAPANLFSLPLQTGANILALWQAFSSWDAPPLRVFASRAPPHQ